MPGPRTGRQLLIVAAACGALFLTISVLVEHGRLDADLAIARWTAAHRSALGTDVFEALSYLGSVFGIVPIAIVLSAYLNREYGWSAVRWLWLAAGGATALYLATNLSLELPRPPLELRVHDELGWSYPSGHSTQTVAFWITTAVLLSAGRPRWVARLCGGLAAVIIVATGASRIYLDVHWTFDVLAGFCLGGMWCAIVLALRAMREPEVQRRARAASS